MYVDVHFPYYAAGFQVGSRARDIFQSGLPTFGISRPPRGGIFNHELGLDLIEALSVAPVTLSGTTSSSKEPFLVKSIPLSLRRPLAMPPKKKNQDADDLGAMRAARFGRVKNTLSMGFGG